MGASDKITPLPGPHKKVAKSVYVLEPEASKLPFEMAEALGKARDILHSNDFKEIEFNVVKFSIYKDKISFLSYEDIENIPFPELISYISVDLSQGGIRKGSFECGDNRPILHRKELLFGEDHPRFEEYALLTRTLEGLGLFGETSTIGRKRDWLELLRSVGVRIEGHQVIQIDVDELSSDVQRHRTALARKSLSKPVQRALLNGIIKKGYSIFDYGCGRGDDIAFLTADGFEASGWDPHFAPDAKKHESDVVNLGYVLNVIENPAERVSAIRGAYGLARKALIISAMVEGQQGYKQHQQFRDGVITSRNTFQKYFHQDELRNLIEASLKNEAIPLDSGIFVVFCDEDEREQFILNRQLRTRRERSQRDSLAPGVVLASAHDEEQASRFWELSLDLTRLPQPSELPSDLKVWARRKFKSIRAASQWLEAHFGPDELELAARTRRSTLLSYLALGMFRRRKQSQLVRGRIGRQLRDVFGSVSAAMQEAEQVLFSIAETHCIEELCDEVVSHGFGLYDDERRLLFAKRKLGELPATLQVIVQIAEWFAGAFEASDIIRISPTDNRVTFFEYEDFEPAIFPRLVQRVRVNLAKRTVESLPELDQFPPKYLIGKRTLAGDGTDEELVELDQTLECQSSRLIARRHISALQIARAVAQTLRAWPALRTFSGIADDQTVIEKMQELGMRNDEDVIFPTLNDPCGRYLTYRDLIHCGETQARTQINNLPEKIETYAALRELAVNVLDQVIDEYGMIKLNYGFCSNELSKKIPNRIAPRLDQHASHEVNSKGQPLCSRLGAAVDFIVEYEDMLDVANWIASNCEFDRLYFYGNDKPVHISFSNENARSVTLFHEGESGRRVPRTMSVEKFLLHYKLSSFSS